MSIRFQRAKNWALIFVAAAFSLLIWMVAQRLTAVAGIQNALNRGWEIAYDSHGGAAPDALPDFIDSAVDDLLSRIFVNSIGYYDGTQPACTRNRNEVYLYRFESLFRGPIREIHIYDPEGFRSDLGAALAHFPNLNCVDIIESWSNGPTEADWKLLCTRLRTFRNLEEIKLGGAWITDAALAPLAGHPRLRSVSITYGRLTGECTKTFASMPLLSKLHIEVATNNGERWPSPESEKAIRGALPTVKIDFKESP